MPSLQQKLSAFASNVTGSRGVLNCECGSICCANFTFKMPPKALTPLHQQILDACESKAIGVTDLELISFIPGLNAQQLQQPLNDLLSTCRLKISNFRDETRFVFVPVAEAARLQGLTVHDQMVLQHITESGNHGIWKRDIKMRTGLQTGALDKCLKTLEARQLVKSATSAQGARGKKKIYLLFHLEIADSVTGGSWFAEGEPDDDMIESAGILLRNYVADKGMLCLADFSDFLVTSGSLHKSLSRDEVGQLIRSMVFEGFLIMLPPDHALSLQHKQAVYVRNPAYDTSRSLVAEIPCTNCSVASLCCNGGYISPQNCKYMDQWLSMF